MSRFSSKISIPIILSGIFAITIFIAFDYQKLDATFYGIIFLLAIFIFSFGFAAGQEFSTPIRKILERAISLSNGDLSSRVYLKTKDELEDLAVAFNKIAEEMESVRKEKEAAEREVGIKVRAKTQELEETINALEQKVKNRTVELERLLGQSEKMQVNFKKPEAPVAPMAKRASVTKKRSRKKQPPTVQES